MVKVHITVVVGDDVAHAAHLAERETWKEGLCFWSEPVGGFTDDFEAAKHGVLFFRVLHEGCL